MKNTLFSSFFHSLIFKPLYSLLSPYFHNVFTLIGMLKFFHDLKNFCITTICRGCMQCLHLRGLLGQLSEYICSDKFFFRSAKFFNFYLSSNMLEKKRDLCLINIAVKLKVLQTVLVVVSEE